MKPAARPAAPWEDEPPHLADMDAAPLEDEAPAVPAAPSPVPAPAAVEASSLEVTALGELWSGWVQRLLAADLVNALVRELALQSELVGQAAEAWTLRVERQSLQHPAACEKLLAALQALDPSAAPPRLQVELGPVRDSQAQRLGAAQAERQRLAEDIVAQDPFVQDMVQHWGARIVPGSVKPWSGAAAMGQPV